MNSSQIDAISTMPVSSSSLAKTKAKPSIFTYRLMIFYRFALALVGGYALATLSAIVIAQTFSEDRGNAAMSATLVAFTLWACAFIWVFMVNKTLKASLGIIIPSILLFTVYYFLGN
ncbi:hypothetical protein A6M14_08560 [Acinetobacter sp. Ac_877]|uniref:hypothetical protein n=1 Tax=Acinetobacter portensis TaxID=1839785 RepID=UPI00128DE5C3|nr:hypothetical protein [Acinetobacter portensis]MPW41491.1 hypothetical protein [Acinetobacter portensis]